MFDARWLFQVIRVQDWRFLEAVVWSDTGIKASIYAIPFCFSTQSEAVLSSADTQSRLYSRSKLPRWVNGIEL